VLAWQARKVRACIVVISQSASSSRIYARSFNAAKRTSRDPSGARSGSYRTLSSCDAIERSNTTLRIERRTGSLVIVRAIPHQGIAVDHG
jgi:hypothetical protein